MKQKENNNIIKRKKINFEFFPIPENILLYHQNHRLVRMINIVYSMYIHASLFYSLIIIVDFIIFLRVSICSELFRFTLT